MTDPKRLLWLLAMVLLMLAPFGLLFGVAWERIGVIVIYELALSIWIARWVKQERT